MEPLKATDLWGWINENRASFEPPVGNKVMWEDSQFTAMVIHGPNRRRDFHYDPSDEIFWQLKGAMVLEYFDKDGKRQNTVIREGEIFLLPANVRHSPHRPRDSWGFVVEIKRSAKDSESLSWYCDKCNSELHKVTLSAMDIEAHLKSAINDFDSNVKLRTCGKCGHVQPEHAAEIEPPA